MNSLTVNSLTTKVKEWSHRAWLDTSLILLLSFTITIILTLFLDRLPNQPVIGSVAMQDIKADQNYEIVDQKSSEALREEAARSVLQVYDYDPSVLQDVLNSIRESFDNGRQFLAEHNLRARDELLAPDLESQLKSQTQGYFSASLADEQYDLIRRYRFSNSLEQSLTVSLHEIYKRPIVHNVDELSGVIGEGFTLRKISPDEQYPEETISNLNGFTDIQHAQLQVAQIPLHVLERKFMMEPLASDAADVFRRFITQQTRANVNYNSLETEARRQRAKGNVKNTIIKIQAGESIIRRGDRFEPWHLTVIDGIQRERLKTNRSLKFLGVFLAVNLLLSVIYYFASRYIRKFRPSRKDLVFLGATLILYLLILRISSFMGTAVRDVLPFSVGNFTLLYAIPVAGGAMLVRFILNSETAFVFAVVSSVLAGLFLDSSLEMSYYYLVSGVFMAHVVAHVEKRSTVLLCGLYGGLINAAAVLSLNLISLISISGTVESAQIFSNIVAAFLGGILSAMSLLVFAPLMEALFNYTTDIKLLELANLSHPLLREMIVRAPGTYHHSQIVGILSEAAAGAIGANPLLARVGSYYHDIGKMKKPQYFIENQKGGENPHEKLTPSMSALIIEAHVKDGIEMAREHKLPKKIADMIPEHQGTKLMGYFYNKAKSLADPTVEKVDEKEFRYPGPKPQTREAGVIMLADTIEAAVRSLSDKSPGKIQSTVEKLVNHHFVDEQLDECDLTLRDLHLIAESFVKILVGIYHQRIEYPEGALTGKADNHRKTGSGSYGNTPFQSTTEISNVWPLFRSKDSKGN